MNETDELSSEDLRKKKELVQASIQYRKDRSLHMDSQLPLMYDLVAIYKKVEELVDAGVNHYLDSNEKGSSLSKDEVELSHLMVQMHEGKATMQVSQDKLKALKLTAKDKYKSIKSSTPELQKEGENLDNEKPCS